MVRTAFTICAAALLAGCGALPLTSASTNSSWMAREAKSQDLLYVSNTLFNQVWVFTYPAGRPAGALYGFALPAAICVDKRNGAIFVSDTLANRIQEFAHGGSNPIRTVTDLKNPQGCSVDSVTGDLGVADYTTQAPGLVAIFHKGKDTPTRYSDSNFTSFANCGYDDAGNLFVDGLTPANQAGLAELPKGSAKFRDITLDKSLDAIGSIGWDGAHLAVMSGSGNAIYQLSISGSHAKVEGRTRLENARFEDQFWVQGNRVVVTYYPSHSKRTAVGFWTYPVGGRPSKVLPNLPGVSGVGVSLAARNK